MLRINLKYSSYTKPHCIIIYTEVRVTTLYKMNDIQQQTILFKMIEFPYIWCCWQKHFIYCCCLVISPWNQNQVVLNVNLFTLVVQQVS